MAVSGRKVNIDKEAFERLCGLQCSLDEISDFFNCCPDTIERWCKRTYKMRFNEVFAQKRGRGKTSLRRMQWKLAESSAAMAIFLGKNYLGQSDHVEYVDNTALDKLDEILKGVKENAGADIQ